MSEWQPIDTAPRNKILDIWAVEFGGKPEAPDGVMPIETGIRFCDCEWAGDQLGWIFDNGYRENCSIIRDRGFLPTHWMHPPEAPNDSSNSGIPIHPTSLDTNGIKGLAITPDASGVFDGE